MADLFDSFAGTSAGSILTGALATPHENDPNEPRYFGDMLRTIFTTRGGDLFRSPVNNVWIAIGLVSLLAVVFAVFGYIYGYYKYDNPKILQELEVYKKLLEDDETVMANESELLTNGDALNRVSGVIRNMIKDHTAEDGVICDQDMQALHLIDQMQNERRLTVRD